MITRRRWNDSEVEEWAYVYWGRDLSLITAEAILKISHSTLWWCFTHRLQAINPELYNEVNKKLTGERRCIR